jgi:predicted metalloprotease with PDZ domain
MRSMHRSLRWIPIAVLALTVTSARQTPTAAQTAPTATVSVDAREFSRKVLHVQVVLPATPGPMTVVYPKWIPGEHGPTGPITDVVDLRFSAGNRTITWQRDPIDMYAFHVVVPPGANELTASFDFLMATGTAGFSSAASSTAHVGILSWNQVVLYPQGVSSDAITFKASVQVPTGWTLATSLQQSSNAKERADFAPVSLTTLVDSPVLAGEFFRKIPLDTSARPVELDIAADSNAALDMRQEFTDAMKRLVGEADALYGARHYDRYHFLFTLSDYVAHFGLEHHQSNDTRVGERALVDSTVGDLSVWVLSHEYMHSWNGKYRRPEGLATPNYQEPMKGELLWVYEGLTQYLGTLLAARSGLWTPRLYQERLASVASYLDKRPGRTWRPLVDTTIAAQLLYEAPPEFASTRRGTDFYDEGWLMWLEADTIIRQQTNNQRSLDDFCHKFHGGASGSPAVRTYTVDEVINTLNDIALYDWRTFFTTRVSTIQEHAPLGGIARSGWRLTYTDEPNALLSATEQADHVTDLTASIGLRIKEDGTIEDAVMGSAAYAAGLGPGMKLVSVNDRHWSADALRAAIRAAHSGDGRITLIVENEPAITTLTVTYRDGLREPHLVRDESRADMLAEIIGPHAGKKP